MPALLNFVSLLSIACSKFLLPIPQAIPYFKIFMNILYKSIENQYKVPLPKSGRKLSLSKNIPRAALALAVEQGKVGVPGNNFTFLQCSEMKGWSSIPLSAIAFFQA
jgi:hypothetical protein